MIKMALEVKRRTRAGMKSEVSFSEDHAEGMHWSRFKDKEINHIVNIFLKRNLSYKKLHMALHRSCN